MVCLWCVLMLSSLKPMEFEHVRTANQASLESVTSEARTADGPGPIQAGVVFYISGDGNDDASGLSPDQAWQTIGRVNAGDFFPGDRVLFRRGDTWRESLVITWSGQPDAYITFGAYGEGPKPRILGSERAEDWSQVSGHNQVWQSGTPLDAPHDGHPSSIFFGQWDETMTWGRIQDEYAVNACGSDFSNLGQEFDWCWQDNAVFVFAPENPGSRYAFVEVPQRRGAITMVGHAPEEYIAIEGLELMFGTMYGYNDGWPMDYEVRGLRIENCHIGYIGIQGGASAMGLVIWHSDMVVRQNEIHDCGRRNISFNVYTDNGRHHPNLVFENVLFEGNVLYHGFHTTGFDVSHGSDSAYPDTFRNFSFRNNFVWDDPEDNPQDNPNDWTSMGLYLWPGSGLFTDFRVENNIFKHIKQKGFAFAGVDNLEIYNNVLYGMNPHIGSYRPMVSMSGDFANLKFYNNIIHGTVSDDPPDGFMLRCVYMGSGDFDVSGMDHNLYYQEDDTQPLFRIDALGESYHMHEWAQYLSDTGWDEHSPTPQDPLFMDPEHDDFRLRPDSPAINAGTAVPGRTADFHGLPLDAQPDIGALEYRENTLIFADEFESGDARRWSAAVP